MKVRHGDVLEAQVEQTFNNGENQYTINVGDKSVIGFDGYIHCLKDRVLIEPDQNMEIEGYSATGLAEFLSVWLDAMLDFNTELRRSILTVDDFKEAIEKGLAFIGMEVAIKNEDKKDLN